MFIFEHFTVAREGYVAEHSDKDSSSPFGQLAIPSHFSKSRMQNGDDGWHLTDQTELLKVLHIHL